MDKKTKIVEVSKDTFEIQVRGINLGIFERSQARHLIEQLDNAVSL